MNNVSSIEPGKTFVRYRPNESDSEHYLGLVAGILGLNLDLLLLCLINRHGSIYVPRTLCIPVSPTTIVKGVLRFRAFEPSFGPGVIVSEARINGLLYVDLERDGKFSGLVPLDEITFLCPCA